MNEPGAIGSYTHGHHESVLRSHASRTVADSAAYLVPHLGPGQRILDVGCGPGSLTADLVAHAPGCEMTAIDASVEVIEQARAAHGDVASFATGDVYALDADDDTFDVVHAHQVLQHLAEPVAALREMRRVAKPGGVVAVRDADYGAMSWSPDLGGLREWMRIYQRATSTNGHDANAGRHLLAWVHAAGFERADTTASVWCYADPERRSWWAEIWADRVQHSGYRDHALAQGLTTEEGLASIAADFRRWADDDDAVFVVPHVEVVAYV